MMVGYASPEERSRRCGSRYVRGDAGKCASETVKREVNQEGWPGRRRGTREHGEEEGDGRTGKKRRGRAREVMVG